MAINENENGCFPADDEDLEWEPPSEAEMKVIQARRERQDQVSKLMGEYLLKGYRMLGECCDLCGVSHRFVGGLGPGKPVHVEVWAQMFALCADDTPPEQRAEKLLRVVSGAGLGRRQGQPW